MNKVYMHYEEYKIWYLKALYTCILGLALWGFYKNGFVYYLQGNQTFFESLRPLFYPAIGAICCLLGEYLSSKKVSINVAIEGILLGIMMPPRFSILIFSVMAIFYSLVKIVFKKKIPTISSLLGFKIITICISTFLNPVNYQNIVEFNKPYLYGIIDTFFGRSVGNVGTTSIFILIILYFIKTSDFFYKKELPIYIIAGYSVLTIIYSILIPQENMLLNLLNSHVYFMAIVLATVPKTSPAEKRYLVVFGVITGILSFVFQNIFHFTNGIYFSLFLLQLIWTIYYYTRKSKNKAKL